MKKLLTILLTIVLLLMPFTTALAAEETFTLGDNVTGVLDTDTGVLTISGTGAMTDYSSIDYNPLYANGYSATITTVIIENGVTSIGNYAFRDCTNLTSITIPDSVTIIGHQAFFDCTSLTSITIPDGVTDIVGLAFDGCTSLISITIPDGVTNIGDSAFDGCTSLTSINIPDGVTNIGDSAFDGCTSLTSITIPDGVTKIGLCAFRDCINLATVINLYNGDQIMGAIPRRAPQPENVFCGAGTAVGGVKVAWAFSANETFIAAISNEGYTVNYSPSITENEGSVEATVPVAGSIEAVSISVTHPTSVEYSIDPNLGYENGAFVAPDIAISNNSAVPINVTVESLSSATGGTLQFADVAADAYLWADLSVAESKAYIALGVKISDGTGWDTGYTTDTRYAVDTADTLFGSLAAGASGNLAMTANYGLAFDQKYTAVHNLVFLFDIA